MMPEVRTVQLRMPSAADLARRCEDANRELLRIQWALEDADRNEQIIDFETAHEWKTTVREANAALALAAAALGSLDG